MSNTIVHKTTYSTAVLAEKLPFLAGLANNASSQYDGVAVVDELSYPLFASCSRTVDSGERCARKSPCLPRRGTTINKQESLTGCWLKNH